MKKYLSLFFLFVVLIIFSWKLFLLGKIPLPSDTIVGLYHPFRDVVWDNFQNGVPFKNFLITDSVRQQYPWRELFISGIKNLQMPFWNPYSFSGTPLFANLQVASLNPLNILLLILPFSYAWGIQVLLQLFLSAFFLFLLLRSWKIKDEAIFLSCISWIFGGFFTAWFEWNTILYVALWLPLILLAKDKIVELISSKVKKYSDLINSRIYFWVLVLIFSEAFSFFSGHLQTFFYVELISSSYLILKSIQLLRDSKKRYFVILIFLFTSLCAFLISAVQLFPFVELVLNSARSFDQPSGFRIDWFLPWKHLVQILVPDFFGNPTTLNYWGEWNYGEFVTYLGVIPLFFAFLSIFSRRDKLTYFFTTFFIISLIFSLPNFLSFIPYNLKIPFISTTAPSRIIFLVDFSLTILAALGLDYFIRKPKFRSIFIPSLIIGVFYLLIVYLVFFPQVFHFSPEVVSKLLISKRNLILPISIYVFLIFGLIVSIKVKKEKLFIIAVLLLTAIDLVRFSDKFNPFITKKYIFPETKTLKYIQKQKFPFRISTTDSRILPPNFSTVYRIESIEGYDPIYSLRYGEYWAAVLRNKPDISSFSFNRIITPHLINSPFINLLNVKYIMSFDEYDFSKTGFKKVYTEGTTKVYENTQVFPRAFMVNKIITTNNKDESIKKLFDFKEQFDKVGIVETNENISLNNENVNSKAIIRRYFDNGMEIETESSESGMLIIGNVNYPGWRVQIDGVKTKIYNVDYILQGVLIPSGKHFVKTTYLPTSFLIGLATSIFGLFIIVLSGIAVWLRRK